MKVKRLPFLLVTLWLLGAAAASVRASYNYLSFPGTSGSYAVTPDSAAVSVSGLDIQLDIAPVSWGGTKRLVCKRIPSTAYDLYLDGGCLGLYDGTGSYTSAPLGFAPGSRHSVRAAVTTDNGSGAKSVQFYVGTEFGTWTAHGSPVVGGTAGVILDTSGPVYFGCFGDGASDPFAGKLYRVRILDGIDGPVALDLRSPFASPGTTSFPESSVNAATITLNGATAIVGVAAPSNPAVFSPAFGFGL